jgi:hypothetical protein
METNFSADVTKRQGRRFAAALMAVAPLLGASGASAANLVPNGNFAVPAPGITPPTIVSYTTPPGGSNSQPQSAAADWVMFINDSGGDTITTQLVPSTFPGAPAGTLMMHVTVSAFNSGLISNLPRAYGGTLYTCAWLLINHGAVGVGSGLGAYSEQNAILDKQGSWEVLNVGNQGTGPTGKTNLTLVYATQSIWDPVSVTDFYVQNVTLSASHNQCRPY